MNNMDRIEIRYLSDSLINPLINFLYCLNDNGDNAYFSPHPFTEETIIKIISHMIKDQYYVLMKGSKVIGYGMLRGWDSGYDVPSAGIAIHPLFRSIGFGRILMNYLHVVAKYLGSKKIMLRVHPANHKAFNFYKSLGYIFEEEGNYLVGILGLLPKNTESLCSLIGD
jgi:[ribosomal protein S18]-alanine N-acetyltransferase